MAEMHRMFATWINSLHSSGNADEAKVAEWWAACEAQIDDSGVGEIIGLVRLAFGRPESEFDASWRAHVAEHDALFPLKGGDQKVSVVAAAAVMLASESPRLGPAALLARLCATRAGWTPSIDDVAGDTSAIRTLADSRRELGRGWPRRAAITVDLDAAKEPITAVVNEGGGSISPAAMTKIVDALGAAVDSSVMKVLNRVSDLTLKREAPLREQSDVLVWLMRGRSTALDVAWSDLSQVDAAVAAAIELNELSRFDVGRADAKALIDFKIASASKKSKADPQRVRILAASDDGLGRLAPTRLAVSEGKVDERIDAAIVGLHLHDELNLARLLQG